MTIANISNKWWDYPTSYGNGSSVNGAGDLFFDYPSLLSDGKFALGIILLIWMAIFGIMLAFGSKKAMLVASFITLIFAIGLVVAGWLNIMVVIVLIVLIIIGSLGSKDEVSY